MDSAYKERVNCLKNLDSQDKGHRQHSLLEKERKKTEESVKHFKHMLGWKRERYDVSEAEKDISDTKKEAAEKLKNKWCTRKTI
jgi:hypothetical protein